MTDNTYVPAPEPQRAEDGARYIVEILINSSGADFGKILKTTDFMMPMSVHPWSTSMFNVYMDEAVARGWVEAVDQISFRLTNAGQSSAWRAP